MKTFEVAHMQLCFFLINISVQDARIWRICRIRRLNWCASLKCLLDVLSFNILPFLLNKQISCFNLFIYFIHNLISKQSISCYNLFIYFYSQFIDMTKVYFLIFGKLNISLNFSFSRKFSTKNSKN